MAFLELCRRCCRGRIVAPFGVVKHLDVMEYIGGALTLKGVMRHTLWI
jgi:hypothetical protein